MKSPAGELYDDLQEMFGLGDPEPDLEWWQLRGREVGKVARMLKARHCTPDEVRLAAAYAQRIGKHITAYWQVFELIPEALRDQRRREAAERLHRIEHELDEAIEEAIDTQQGEWAERLARARNQLVLTEWRKHVEDND
jgi:hypothetical protein